MRVVPFFQTEIGQMLGKGASAATRSGWSDYLKQVGAFRGGIQLGNNWRIRAEVRIHRADAGQLSSSFTVQGR